ncbi:MAG: hypothetical protein EBZ48_04305 [Proteobacteria bacterium]|nr:hypothetical protein [Pseudomonadota bacterium]
MDFIEHKNSLAQETANAVRELVRRADTMEQIVREWCGAKNRSITLGTGIDDDEKHTLMWIALKDSDRNAFELFVPLSEVYARHPSVRSFAEFASVGSDEGWQQILVDEKRLKEYLQFDMDEHYNDELCSPLVKLGRCMPLILAYALSDIGEASISVDPLLCEEVDLEAVGCRELAYLSMGYSLSEPINGVSPGIHESIYLDLSL